MLWAELKVKSGVDSLLGPSAKASSARWSKNHICLRGCPMKTCQEKTGLWVGGCVGGDETNSNGTEKKSTQSGLAEAILKPGLRVLSFIWWATKGSRRAVTPSQWEESSLPPVKRREAEVWKLYHSSGDRDWEQVKYHGPPLLPR